MKANPLSKVLLAPVRWYEQTRACWRLPLLLLAALVLGSGGIFISREVMLWQIPEVPEPAILARADRGDRPAAANAVPHYQQAAAMLVRQQRDFRRRSALHRTSQVWNWQGSPPEIRALVELNRPALAAWRTGTACSDAFPCPPRGTESALEQGDLLSLSFLGALEGSRLQADGDLAGAWAYYLGVIRSSLHASRQGGVNFAVLEARIMDSVAPQVRSWLEDSRLTPELLRMATADLAECRRLMSPPSDLVRSIYLSTRDNLDSPQQPWSDPRTASTVPDWSRQFAAFGCWLRNEPKRSQKIFRLLTAGHLAHLDRPAHERPRVISTRYLIFDRDARTPPDLAGIKPNTLLKWAHSSRCRTELPDLGPLLDSIQAARITFDRLQLTLADRSDSAETATRTASGLNPSQRVDFPAGRSVKAPLVEL